MKRFLQGRSFKSKWVVPVAALVLTLSVGSIAFAATESGTKDFPTVTTESPAAVSLPTSTTATAAAVAAGSDQATAATAVSDESTPSSALLATQQARENAILDLIREKMTSTDQATFDQLRVTAAEQQAAVQQATAELSDTVAKINALVDKYLGVSTSADASSTSTDASTTSSTDGVSLEVTAR